MIKYNIAHIYTCNSQYFGGHHLPIVQVLVDENTSFKDIKEVLSYLQTYEHLFEDDRFSTGFDVDAYKAAVEEVFSYVERNHVSLERIPNDLEGIGSMDDDEEWDCYMYFVVEQVGDEE